MINLKLLKEKFSGISRYGSRFQEQGKQKKIIIGVIAVIGIVVFNEVTSKEEVKKEDKQVRTQKDAYNQQKLDASKAQAIVIPGSKVNSQDIWMQQGQRKIGQVEQVNNQLSTDLDQQKAQNDAKDQQRELEIKTLNDKLDALTSKLSDQQQALAKANSSAPIRGVGVSGNSGPDIHEIDMDSDDSNSGSINNPSLVNSQNPQQAPYSSNGIVSNITSTKDKKKSVSEYLPSSTVMKGYLIEGISANTGGNANSEPTPLIIQITNLADLPNFFRSNVRNCRISGSGYGDLSTERVKVRLDKLACVLKNGNVIDIPVKGHVAGEDGKAGIRGVVVSHNGSALAKAALASTLSGLGNAAQAAAQTQMVSPIGTTTTINPNQAFGSALAGGVGGGFNTLSQYYTNMLNQITPAIEVSSGRHVDVILQDGAELKESLGKPVMSNDSQLPLNELNR